ncbi:glutathione S-transferase alpha-4 [Strongylocentrotus purpuratus]|uniref:Glutathione transferase n=1 Tax=Strongylocentrotus purpuratus TaxID=7668 RepID=A0A7M7RF86_STRPU|nr:glutathione S-transferase alpha-4 [Strongylocentrotus purpuratus]|eukprot:XP_788101.1 PREDICTED: glutathione S-transferase alpha-4 isoform X1 [Strongylocentrotus purpuratus]
MSKPRLTYFAGRGFAEVTRLALNAAQIEYDDVYLRTREEFLQLITDGKLMFKQVPLLEIDGKNLIGSECVLRYVCNKAKLQGKSDDDQSKIEMLSMGARDMLKGGFSGAKFQATPEKEEEMLQSAAKQCKDRYLPVFEKVLGENKSGFLVGDSLTMADLMFFDGLSYVNEIPKIKSLLDDFPNCKAFIVHFSSQPGIKEYLASPRRHPPPNDEYVRGVRKVLNPPSS